MVGAVLIVGLAEGSLETVGAEETVGEDVNYDGKE